MTNIFEQIGALLNVPETLERIEEKVDAIMGYVKVQQEQLDEIDRQLDESTASIEAKLNALDLPEADLAPIMEDLNNLKGLHTADVPSEPVVDNTLPGDLPPE